MHEPLLVPRASYGLKDGVLRLTFQQKHYGIRLSLSIRLGDFRYLIRFYFTVIGPSSPSLIHQPPLSWVRMGSA
jgi:hypothetical protein